MAEADPALRLLDEGELAFTIESRLIRELGERLVREPEVALLELIKNAYDADATSCEVRLSGNDRIEIVDDGSGMSLDDFTHGWMRIGTSSKGARSVTERFNRPITGEKGIGRFAVRYLGQRLDLASIAFDDGRGTKTRLEAEFEWTDFDRREDLKDVTVPYRLVAVDSATPTGTVLTISDLKPVVHEVDWKALRTGSMGVVSPVRSLIVAEPAEKHRTDLDPGFQLVSVSGEEELNVADEVLAHYALRATIELSNGRLHLQVFKGGEDAPYLSIEDEYPSHVGDVRGDIRFFPRREGLFAGAEFDGRKAYTWIRENSGVKVFDRNFQVRPYGTPGNDWLDLNKDAARNLREPTSPVMIKHYPMDPAVKSSTALNWMLRLPQNAQLIGVVQVKGRREAEGHESGLIAAADREGFLANDAFHQLKMLVRAASEAIAYADREISLEEARLEDERKLEEARETTKRAIEEIQADRTLTVAQRARIVDVLEQTQERAEAQRKGNKEREQQLEVMSLLGVVAGFMTHEFGVALAELKDARQTLAELSQKIPEFADRVTAFDEHIEALRSFVRYSRAYVEGARTLSNKPFAARPRFEHVVAAFGRYAEKRRIELLVDVLPDVIAPRVPPALYDGIAQNLLTNSLKALTASTKRSDRRIVFRAWNDERWHHIQVSDTGPGIPEAIRDLVFDPLFTTTDKKNADPLGSGMGLGLALVRRGAAAFGGKADLVAPPPGFTTCVEVLFPREATE
jgi:signal transduction histidine kinase